MAKLTGLPHDVLYHLYGSIIANLDPVSFLRFTSVCSELRLFYLSNKNGYDSQIFKACVPTDFHRPNVALSILRTHKRDEITASQFKHALVRASQRSPQAPSFEEAFLLHKAIARLSLRLLHVEISESWILPTQKTSCIEFIRHLDLISAGLPARSGREEGHFFKPEFYERSPNGVLLLQKNQRGEHIFAIDYVTRCCYGYFLGCYPFARDWSRTQEFYMDLMLWVTTVTGIDHRLEVCNARLYPGGPLGTGVANITPIRHLQHTYFSRFSMQYQHRGLRKTINDLFGHLIPESHYNAYIASTGGLNNPYFNAPSPLIYPYLMSTIVGTLSVEIVSQLIFHPKEKATRDALITWMKRISEFEIVLLMKSIPAVDKQRKKVEAKMGTGNTINTDKWVQIGDTHWPWSSQELKDLKMEFQTLMEADKAPARANRAYDKHIEYFGQPLSA